MTVHRHIEHNTSNSHYIYIYARYTGTVKLPVFIIFQTVRYHNLHNLVFHTLLFPSSECFSNRCASGKCDIRTNEQHDVLNRLNYQLAWNKQMKRTVEVKYGITLHTKQKIKVNELTTGGKTSNLAKHLSLAPDLLRELTLEIDRVVSAS